MGDLLAFAPHHVTRLTGVSIRQLYYWDTKGLLAPEYADAERRHPLSRVYSFRDVVALRTLGILRKTYRVPLQELRKVDKWLRAHYDYPWSSLRLYVRGREILFVEPQSSQKVSASRAGQFSIPIEMDEIVHDVRREADRLRDRNPEQIGQIDRNRFVVHNAPVVSGTRIPTSGIWNFHLAGFIESDILREYPQLTVADVRAAIDFEEQRRAKKVS